VTDGTPVMVTLNTTTSGIDFALERLGVISGTVTEAATGDPIPSARVNIWDDNPQLWMRCPKILMLWYLRKAQAYFELRRSFRKCPERKRLVQIATS
jgi:hypothetical protein